MSERDNLIPFWRVVFTYVIILLHIFNQYGYTTAWAIGVEFFFVVSGWLMAVDLKTKERTPYEYLWHRIKRLYPEYISAFLVSAACLLYFNSYSFEEGVYWAETIGVKELLCIHYWGWNEFPMANPVTWYVSVLLLAGLLMYSLCKRFPHVTKEIIIPLSIVVGLTYSYRTYGVLTDDFYEGISYHHRFVRGFLEIGIGILLHDFCERYGKYLKNKCIQVIGFIILCFTIIEAHFYGGKMEYLYLLLISFGVAVSFTTKQAFKSKVLMFMDKISYSVFLNHAIFRHYIIPSFFGSLSFGMILTYIVLVTLYSILMYYISNFLNRQFKKFCLSLFKNQIVPDK